MSFLTASDLTELEVAFLKIVPPHTHLAATEFTYVAKKAGLSWDEGKTVLASLLEKNLIADLNANTLDTIFGVCDRTPLGDLALGVFISISEEEDGTFVVKNPPSYHDEIDGRASGPQYTRHSYEDAFAYATRRGTNGATVVIVGQDGNKTPVGYVQTVQDSDSLGEAAPNVSWSWNKLRKALGIEQDAVEGADVSAPSKNVQELDVTSKNVQGFEDSFSFDFSALKTFNGSEPNP